MEVTPWDEGVRMVSFVMPLAAPDFVKKMMGADMVKVRAGVWAASSVCPTVVAALVQRLWVL